MEQRMAGRREGGKLDKRRWEQQAPKLHQDPHSFNLALLFVITYIS